MPEPAAPAEVTPSDSRLQQILPHYDVNEFHAVDVHAPAEVVYRALQAHRLGDSPLARALFALRGLSSLVAARGRRPQHEPQREPPWIEALCQGGFVKLVEVPDEEIVAGLIGKFWLLAPALVRLADPEAFLRFADRSYARAAINFRLMPLENGITRLSTETRVSVPDPASRRRFRLYWALIGPFSGLIRMEMLRQIRRAAEGSLAGPPARLAH